SRPTRRAPPRERRPVGASREAPAGRERLVGERLPAFVVAGRAVDARRGQRGRHTPLWRREVGRAPEVEDLGEVARLRVADGQRSETEAPLDQLEDRGVVVEIVRDALPART